MASTKAQLARSIPAVRSPSPLATALGAVVVAFGAVAIGAYMLDLHGHSCEACGHRWRHLGAFNLGDPGSHTCAKCGTVQWWKDGVPHVFREAVRPMPDPPPAPTGSRVRQLVLEAPWEQVGRRG